MLEHLSGLATSTYAQTSTRDHTLQAAESLWGRAVSLANALEGEKCDYATGGGEGAGTGDVGSICPAGWNSSKAAVESTALGLGLGSAEEQRGDECSATIKTDHRVREKNKSLQREINALRARHTYDQKEERRVQLLEQQETTKVSPVQFSSVTQCVIHRRPHPYQHSSHHRYHLPRNDIFPSSN